MDKIRPEGIFLFLGATGVGKSFVASKIAEYLFGSKEKLRIIDLEQYKTPADFLKLLYGSKMEPGVLVQEVENHPFSVFLFENILEADSAVLSTLGKILNKGEIIDPVGEKYFLSRIIFILNLTKIGEEKKATHIGFIKGEKDSKEIIVPSKIMDVLDWVDEIVEFTPLTEEHLKLIAKEKLNEMIAEIKEKYKRIVTFSSKVLSTISREALKAGGFAHSVSEFIDRKIRIKLLDLITKEEKKEKFEIDVKLSKIDINKK